MEGGRGNGKHTFVHFSPHCSGGGRASGGKEEMEAMEAMEEREGKEAKEEGGSDEKRTFYWSQFNRERVAAMRGARPGKKKKGGKRRREGRQGEQARERIKLFSFNDMGCIKVNLHFPFLNYLLVIEGIKLLGGVRWDFSAKKKSTFWSNPDVAKAKQAKQHHTTPLTQCQG